MGSGGGDRVMIARFAIPSIFGRCVLYDCSFGLLYFYFFFFFFSFFLFSVVGTCGSVGFVLACFVGAVCTRVLFAVCGSGVCGVLWLHYCGCVGFV